MKLFYRLLSIGKTSSTQFLNAMNQYPVARTLEFTTCRGGRVEKVSRKKFNSISGIVKAKASTLNTRELFTTCKKTETRLKLLTIMGSSATLDPSLWITLH